MENHNPESTCCSQIEISLPQTITSPIKRKNKRVRIISPENKRSKDKSNSLSNETTSERNEQMQAEKLYLTQIQDLIDCHKYGSKELNKSVFLKLIRVAKDIESETNDDRIAQTCEDLIYRLNTILSNLKPKVGAFFLPSQNLSNKEGIQHNERRDDDKIRAQDETIHSYDDLECVPPTSVYNDVQNKISIEMCTNKSAIILSNDMDVRSENNIAENVREDVCENIQEKENVDMNDECDDYEETQVTEEDIHKLQALNDKIAQLKCVDYKEEDMNCLDTNINCSNAPIIIQMSSEPIIISNSCVATLSNHDVQRNINNDLQIDNQNNHRNFFEECSKRSYESIVDITETEDYVQVVPTKVQPNISMLYKDKDVLNKESVTIRHNKFAENDSTKFKKLKGILKKSVVPYSKNIAKNIQTRVYAPQNIKNKRNNRDNTVSFVGLDNVPSTSRNYPNERVKSNVKEKYIVLKMLEMNSKFKNAIDVTNNVMEQSDTAPKSLGLDFSFKDTVNATNSKKLERTHQNVIPDSTMMDISTMQEYENRSIDKVSADIGTKNSSSIETNMKLTDKIEKQQNAHKTRVMLSVNNNANIKNQSNAIPNFPLNNCITNSNKSERMYQNVISDNIMLNISTKFTNTSVDKISTDKETKNSSSNGINMKITDKTGKQQNKHQTEVMENNAKSKNKWDIRTAKPNLLLNSSDAMYALNVNNNSINPTCDSDNISLSSNSGSQSSVHINKNRIGLNNILNNICVNSHVMTHISKIFNIPEQDLRLYCDEKNVKTSDQDKTQCNSVSNIAKELRNKRAVMEYMYLQNDVHKKLKVDNNSYEENRIAQRIWAEHITSETPQQFNELENRSDNNNTNNVQNFTNYKEREENYF